jgi:hypothetical protein
MNSFIALGIFSLKFTWESNKTKNKFEKIRKNKVGGHLKGIFF